MKVTEECVMYTEKHILDQKMYTNGLNMGLPLQIGAVNSASYCQLLRQNSNLLN